MHTDHYQALGVHPQASQADIRAAYLRLMRANHPDRRPGDPAAAEVARRVNAAWEVLGSSAARASYDRLRAAGRVPAVRALRAPVPARRAYSAERAHVRHAFQRASLRLGIAIFALGCLLLLAVR
jgi:curved DNA-binding protein CbpA